MIGLFIGSFNPPTLAHLQICLSLKKMFSKIIFIPVNTKEKKLVSMYHRINMLKIYTKKYSFLEVDNIMENYSYFDYRILDLLKRKYHNVKVIVGSDILNNLKNFDNKKYLISNYEFIVITRDSFDAEKIINNYYGDYKKNFIVHQYTSDISSTKVREYIKNKMDTKKFLDMEIDFYIRENQLYF